MSPHGAKEVTTLT